MKILLAGIIIGLLSMSPAFAESHMDKEKKETGEQRVLLKSDSYELQDSDQGGQGATDQDNRYGQDGEQDQMMRDSGEGRHGALDRARTGRTTEVEPQEGYERVSSDIITAEDLQDANVYTSDNESVADVKEVLITPEGRVDQVVVDVGGFLGMGARSIAIDMNEADVHKDMNNDVRVYIPMSEEELRQMPEYKREN